MENNRNFLIAMLLSIAVLVGWQFLIVGPRMEAQRQAQIAAGETPGSLQTPQTPAGTPQQSLPTPAGRESVVPGTVAAAPGTRTREEALAGVPRVPIDTPTLAGSINLKGGRLDDLRLKRYHETVDDASPTIVLLSPEAAPEGYFVENGYAGPNVPGLPGPDTLWVAEGSQTLTADKPVRLTYTNEQGLRFERTIAVDPRYMFTITDKVTNGGTADVSFSPYGRVVRFSKPQVQSAWVVFEGLLGVFGEQGFSEVTYKTIEGDARVQHEKSSGGWLGITDKYWAATLVPQADRPFEGTFAYQSNGRPQYQSFYQADPATLAPGASTEFSTRSFAGPKVVDIIDTYEHDLGIKQFSQLIDWGWFFFITRPLFKVIDWLFNFTGNFGAAILIVTVALKLLFFPLANKSYQSMAKMKNLQPKIAELRERYGDDKMKQQQAMMEIYRKEKINPAAGCLPILLQIPVFFALYKVLYVTIEMRHAPFFGWIQDLAAPDPTSVFNLFGLIPFTPPHALMIGVWPLLMGITMFVQMKLNPAPPDPTQKMLFTWMPVLFTFMLSSFPAGLVIYWSWNNTLSIIQQSVIMKRNGTKIELFDNLRDLFKRKTKEAGN